MELSESNGPTPITEPGKNNTGPEEIYVDPERTEEVAVGQNGKRFKLLSPANTYAAKKTVAQGMMDIALITANANQLRYILEFGDRNTVFYVITMLIVISILLQVAVGVCLIFKGRYDMAGDSKQYQANRLNNYVVMGVFLVTIINVFAATFTISRKQEPGPS